MISPFMKTAAMVLVNILVFVYYLVKEGRYGPAAIDVIIIMRKGEGEGKIVSGEWEVR